MPISVNVNTNAEMDARLLRLMNLVNVQRSNSGLQPFTDVNDMARSAMIERLRGWLRELFGQDAQVVMEAWLGATDAVQEQVKTLLGI